MVPFLNEIVLNIGGFDKRDHLVNLIKEILS